MNEIYALEPSVELDCRGLRFLLDKFGFAEGRFLAELPSNWKRELLGRFDGLERVRATELLSRKVFVPIDFRYNHSIPWRSNAERALMESRPRLSAAIVSGSNQPGFLSADSLLDDPAAALPDSRGAHIERTAESYLRAIEPLLKTSSEIFLVDRFFTCWNGSYEKHRQTKFLVGLLKLASKHRVCERVELINGRAQCLVGRDESSWQDFLTDVRLKSAVTSLSLVYSFVEDWLREGNPSEETSGDSFHPRYIFSKFAGLQFDWGFDVDNRSGQKNHVHWLSQAELEPLVRQFC